MNMHIPYTRKSSKVYETIESGRAWNVQMLASRLFQSLRPFKIRLKKADNLRWESECGVLLVVNSLLDNSIWRTLYRHLANCEMYSHSWNFVYVMAGSSSVGQFLIVSVSTSAAYHLYRTNRQRETGWSTVKKLQSQNLLRVNQLSKKL